jgi:ABC-type lipoprotein export system ATPase subunit
VRGFDERMRLALEIQDLKKTYIGPDGVGVPILNVPAFTLGDREQVALVGSSGSGKTTLLHAIAGIIAPDSGVVRFTDAATNQYVDVAQLPEAARDAFRGRNLGYVFQTHHLLSGFTALENVLLGMSFTGRSADRSWATSLLKEVGLSDRMNYKPAKLSVGQQQRVAVARALANRPRLVLADEPTGALDSTNAQLVLELIRKLCESVGSSLLMVTHDRTIADQFSRVVDLASINKAAAGYSAKGAA